MNELRFHEPWLQERMKLFENYTLPSVMAQIDQDFRWIVIVHPDTSPWVVKRLRCLPKLEVRQFEWDVDAKEPGGHVTINLDTDDAISRDFTVEARKIDFVGETIFVRGMKFRILTKCWITSRTDNAHFNVVNHPELTVLDFSHGMGPLEKDLVDLKRPMWLEVIHEKNVANKLRTAKADQNMGPRFASQYFELNWNEVVEMYGRGIPPW